MLWAFPGTILDTMEVAGGFAIFQVGSCRYCFYIIAFSTNTLSFPLLYAELKILRK